MEIRPGIVENLAMSYSSWVNWFSTTPVGSWIARKLAARIDPVVYRATGGRFTSTGVPTIPQLILTTTGRKSGQPRQVQLGYVGDGDPIVVATNFGRANHPAWSYNLEANPRAVVELGGERFEAEAQRLSEAERDEMWTRFCEVIPQFAVYKTRTDRNIRVYRLVRT